MLSKILLIIIILAHVFILTKLIFFPYPELFIYPYLTNHGLKPYQQILDQHFPGLIFLPINFDNLGMTTPGIAKIWLMGAILITHLLLFLIAVDLFKDKRKALLVNILYLIWQPFFEGWVLWIDSFLPLLLLPAFYFFIRRKFFLTGLFLSFGILFKQTTIPLSGLLLIYLLWQDRSLKTIGSFLTGLVGPIALMIIYLFYIGVLDDFWYWTVIFNLTTYAQFGRGVKPTLAHFSRVFLVFATPFLAAKFFKDKEAQITLIMLIGTLFGLSTRFDFVHFQPALPFAILGTVLVVSKFWKLEVFKIFILVYFLIVAWWLGIFYKGHVGKSVYFFDDQIYRLANKVKQYTETNERIFVLGSVPHLYQLTNTLPAGNIFVYQFPWFLSVAGERILSGISRDPPQIIVMDKTLEIEGQSINNFAQKLIEYIEKNYQQIDKVGNTEILRRI